MNVSGMSNTRVKLTTGQENKHSKGIYITYFFHISVEHGALLCSLSEIRILQSMQ